MEEAEALCARVAMLKKGHIVALDSTRDLLERFSVYCLSVRVDTPDNLPEALRRRAKPAQGSLQFQLSGLSEVEPLLAAVRESGCEIKDMRLAATDLEDVFIEIMREQEMDLVGSVR